MYGTYGMYGMYVCTYVCMYVCMYVCIYGMYVRIKVLKHNLKEIHSENSIFPPQAHPIYDMRYEQMRFPDIVGSAR